MLGQSITISEQHLLTYVIMGVLFIAVWSFIQPIVRHIFKRVRKFQVGPVSGELSPEEEEAKSKDAVASAVEYAEVASCHRDCSRVNEIYMLLTIFTQHIKKILEMQDISRATKEQMRVAVVKSNLVLNRYSEKLYEVVKGLGVTTPMTHHIYRDFYAFGRLIMFETLEQIRGICQDNHLAEKTEEEYSKFVRDKSSELLSFIKTLARHHMPQKDDIAGYEDAMVSVHTEITKAVAEFLVEARRISIERMKEAEKLEEELKEKVRKIMEGDYDV